MASIRERNGKFAVIYNYKDTEGVKRQKWETFPTKAEAKKRKKEIEYLQEMGSFTVPKCKDISGLMDEYVTLYGKEHWSLGYYSKCLSLINNYIKPLIGDVKLNEVNTRFLEKFYQSMLNMPGTINPATGKKTEHISTSTVRDVHKILRSAFQQALKWELMDKNPAAVATLPKHKAVKRDIWTAETVKYALDVCDDDRLKIAINLAFSCSLRLGEVLGLTWDCVDISPEAIEENRAYVYINKESTRVDKEAIVDLDGKDIILVFPERTKSNSTVRVLKTPKTESSVRKVFLPRSVAQILVGWKAEQLRLKNLLGEEYMDYGLVIATSNGMPVGGSSIRNAFNRLIEEHDLPKVVFHSLRHTSVTYKLKLNGGDIKAVQGDSGHSQINMVTDVYSHIIDEDRRKNAEMFEDAFYGKKELNPSLRKNDSGENIMSVPEGVDAELLAKVLANPEMTALLTSLAKTMK